MAGEPRRVAVTGVGVVTALGASTAKTWEGLVEGRSGIGPIHGYDVSSLRTKIGGEAGEFDPKEHVHPKIVRKLTRGDQFALVGAILAMADAALELSEEAGTRCALFLGGDKEVSDLMHLLEPTLAARNPDGSVDIARFGESAQTTAYPLFYVEGLQAAPLFYISERFQVRGPNTYFAGTAEAGLTAIGRAFRAVKWGEADAAIAGGYDDALSWWNTTKLDEFDGYLTGRNDLGAAACRPFDRDRDGTVLGEGTAFVVLEELEAASRRGARIYAEVTGFGSGTDASRASQPHPDGRGLVVALGKALREAKLEPAAVDYVAAHGEATRAGDASEATAIEHVFSGGRGPVAASSVKPATGNLVAAAGALNAAVAALAVHHSTVPPTLNLEHPDPECNHADWIPRQAREMPVTHALALARGFAGQNVVLALKAVT
ncbi:MAG: beta-ketoacyl-[acyl-carrier-protein] synthase family protein [Gaiellaceae bacterium]|jgi:3-oxoacyl-[acyl-carrier-protein] synthase II